MFFTIKKKIITETVFSELPWNYESYETLDSAINYATTLMQELKATWYNILPTKMYELSICTLIQALCESMLERIFANTKPISEDLVYMMVVRFEDTVADIETLFEVRKLCD